MDYFEHVIIYHALTNSGYLAAVADMVKPEYFKDKAVASIFEIIKDFADRRDKLPTATEIKTHLVTDEQKASFKELVHSFKDIDKDIDRDELYDNTETFLKEKSVYHTMLDVAEDVSKGKVDTSVVLDKFEQACSVNLVTDVGFDMFGDIDELIEDLNKEQRYIPSKWEWLDDCLGGGFQENGRALYVFSGETNIGKSIFLGNVARNMAEQGKNVLLISLEMPELLYAQRICSNITKIPMSELQHNGPTIKHIIEQEPGNIFIKEFPPATITPNQIKAFVKRFGEKGIKLDAIVLDYLNLVEGVGNNSYERVKHVTEKIRALTYQFKLPIISATQLNRSGFDVDNPDITSISESYGLAATADCLISIFQSEEDREMEVIRLGMMKNRFGPRGVTQAMRIDYPTLSIEQADDVDLDDDEDETLNALANLAL